MWHFAGAKFGGLNIAEENWVKRCDWDHVFTSLKVSYWRLWFAHIITKT